jgi:RecA/RadA recombinase
MDSRDINNESVGESSLALQAVAQVEESKDRDIYHDSRAILEKNRLAEKRFDKMFGKSKNATAATSRPQTSAIASKIATSSAAASKAGKEVIDSRGQKVVITAPEGTVEYWNQMREALGMKKLK